MKQKLAGISVIFILVCFAACTVFIAMRLHRNSKVDKAYKDDYYTVNQIKYGLLSGDNWSLQVNRIIAQQIDSFTFSPENKKLLEKEISGVLNRLFDEANKVLHKEHRKLKDRIRFKVLNALVSTDDFKADIPRFSKAIINELDKSKNKEQIKKLLKDKVSSILNAANQDVAGEQQRILDNLHCSGIEAFNQMVAKRTNEIKEEQQKLGYILIGFLVATLLMWFLIVRLKFIYTTAFLLSVAISFITLTIGVSLPMIEIDARIATLDLKLLSSHIVFKDQVIFFRTKSILDVIEILVKNGKADSVFVGCLILIFSVLFPVTKLVSATILLFRGPKSNGFIKYMAFKSGKWSMADVMVVAIFMSYVGFRSILNDQLEDIAMHDDTINLITTNRTNVQTGFMIFVSFVLFNLVLAEILKYIANRQNAVKSQ